MAMTELEREIAASIVEALALENNLIKQYKPRFNILRFSRTILAIMQIIRKMVLLL